MNTLSELKEYLVDSYINSPALSDGIICLNSEMDPDNKLYFHIIVYKANKPANNFVNTTDYFCKHGDEFTMIDYFDVSDKITDEMYKLNMITNMQFIHGATYTIVEFAERATTRKEKISNIINHGL